MLQLRGKIILFSCNSLSVREHAKNIVVDFDSKVVEIQVFH